MASFTGVGDNVELQMRDKGDEVLISLSGTYNMTILFQREIGSPGSGAWETLRTYSTANATVAATYITERYDEKLRLIVSVDTSGTCTATLADNLDKTEDYLTVRDRLGRRRVEFSQGRVIFYDEDGARMDAAVAITAATTLVAADHAGRTIIFNDADGATVTLPAATGSGDIYRFFVAVTVTSNSDKIQVANATDIIQGVLGVATDAAGVNVPAGASDDTITMNGSTTGGVKGSWVELQDVASGIWSVRGALVSTGAEATPFSAAVS